MNWIEKVVARAQRLFTKVPRGIRLLPGVIFFIIISSLSYSIFINYLFEKGGGDITVVIPPGVSLKRIEESLLETGALNDPRGFALMCKLMRIDYQLKAGRYLLEKNSPKLLLLKTLSKGRSEPFRITIPEGIRIEKIAEILERELGMEKMEILKLLKDGEFSKELGFHSSGLEGYLFPDTYELVFETSLKEVVGVMAKRLLDVIEEADREREDSTGHSLHEVLTIASMIEKEVIFPSEAPIVGGVLYNRIRLRMPLQCDATIQYALEERKKRLTYEDLKVDSPYNTYLHLGLPPGPICNPSKSSIEAALSPEKVDYLYYVARPNGTHIFSRTHAEHVKAKRQAKREWELAMNQSLNPSN